MTKKSTMELIAAASIPLLLAAAGCGEGGKTGDADAEREAAPETADAADADTVPAEEGMEQADPAPDDGGGDPAHEELVPSPEQCAGGVDEDLDGLTDCEDSDCRTNAACDESAACANGIDDDLDGLVDCEDTEQCSVAQNCYESDCGDGDDDDGDGRADCRDFDCAGDADCAGGTGPLGSPCDEHDDCASGACLMEEDHGWAGGYCSPIGWTDAHCATCPGDTICLALDTVGPFVCALRCNAADCRAGYKCVTGEGDDRFCVGGCYDAAQCVATGWCSGTTARHGHCETPPELCAGGADEDGDTRADCADPDCVFLPACTAASPLAGGAACAAAAAVAVPTGRPATVVVTGTLSPGDGDDHDPACDEGYSTADTAYTFTLAAAARVTIDLLGAGGGLDAPVLSLARACAEPDIRCSFLDAGGSDHARIAGLFTPGSYFVHVEADKDLGALGAYALGFMFETP